MSARYAFPSKERSCPRHCRWAIASPLAAAILLWGVGLCLGGAAEKSDGEENGPPKPEVKTILTGDGVRLMATYYPHTEDKNQGKDAAAVVLLHMYKRSRNDYAGLAEMLQKQGHAVLVPDLRGHGESTEKRGMQAPLNADDLSRRDFVLMVTSDMEAIKDFLRSENNEGKLNIEKLCLVGAEMGASVALTWTQLDWSRPPVGIYKLGQDVKALVLISPDWSTPGLSLKTALTNSNTICSLTDPLLISAAKKGLISYKNAYQLDMRREVAALIVAGEGDAAAVRDAERVHSMLKRYHPDPPRTATADQQQQDLFYGPLETKLQGTKMLGESGLNLEDYIAEFIRRCVAERQYPWQKRSKDPHSPED